VDSGAKMARYCHAPSCPGG